MQINKISGLIATPYTPLKSNGDINPKAIPAYAVGCMGPIFLKPGRVEELLGFCVEVATGVSGIDLSMNELNLANARFATLNPVFKK